MGGGSSSPVLGSVTANGDVLTPQMKDDQRHTAQSVLLSEDLRKTLTTEVTQMHLLAFMKKTYCAENLLFYIAVDELKDIEAKEGHNERYKAKLEEISNEYIQVGSPNEINIKDVTRQKIKSAIDSGEVVSATVLTEAQNEIYVMIKTNSWQAFVASEEFEKLITITPAKNVRILRGAQ